jgi:hypothetical protein
MPIAAILALVAALSPAQWGLILGMLPPLIQGAEAIIPRVGQGVHAIIAAVQGRMASHNVSHTDAAKALITEGFAVPGWTDAETKAWLDNATPNPNIG